MADIERLRAWAQDEPHLVQSVRHFEPHYPNPAALRKDVREVIAALEEKLSGCDHDWRLANESKILQEHDIVPDEHTLAGVKLELRHDGWRRRWYCTKCRVFETRNEPLEPGEART